MPEWDPDIPYLMIITLHSPGKELDQEIMKQHARSLTPHSTVPPIAKPIHNREGDRVLQWWVQIPALSPLEELQDKKLQQIGYYHFFEWKIERGTMVFENKYCNCHGEFSQNTTHDIVSGLNLEKWSGMKGLEEIFGDAKRAAQEFPLRGPKRNITKLPSPDLQGFPQDLVDNPVSYGGGNIQPQYPYPLNPGHMQQYPYHQSVHQHPGPSLYGQPTQQFAPQLPGPEPYHPQVQQQPTPQYPQYPQYGQSPFSQNTAGFPINSSAGVTAQERRGVFIDGIPTHWTQARLENWMQEMSPNLTPKGVEVITRERGRGKQAKVMYSCHQDAKQAARDFREKVFEHSLEHPFTAFVNTFVVRRTSQ